MLNGGAGNYQIEAGHKFDGIEVSTNKPESVHRGCDAGIEIDAGHVVTARQHRGNDGRFPAADLQRTLRPGWQVYANPPPVNDLLADEVKAAEWRPGLASKPLPKPE